MEELKKIIARSRNPEPGSKPDDPKPARKVDPEKLRAADEAVKKAQHVPPKTGS